MESEEKMHYKYTKFYFMRAPNIYYFRKLSAYIIALNKLKSLESPENTPALERESYILKESLASHISPEEQNQQGPQHAYFSAEV